METSVSYVFYFSMFASIISTSLLFLKYVGVKKSYSKFNFFNSLPPCTVTVRYIAICFSYLQYVCTVYGKEAQVRLSGAPQACEDWKLELSKISTLSNFWGLLLKVHFTVVVSSLLQTYAYSYIIELAVLNVASNTFYCIKCNVNIGNKYEKWVGENSSKFYR